MKFVRNILNNIKDAEKEEGEENKKLEKVRSREVYPFERVDILKLSGVACSVVRELADESASGARGAICRRGGSLGRRPSPAAQRRGGRPPPPAPQPTVPLTPFRSPFHLVPSQPISPTPIPSLLRTQREAPRIRLAPSRGASARPRAPPRAHPPLPPAALSASEPQSALPSLPKMLALGFKEKVQPLASSFTTGVSDTDRAANLDQSKKKSGMRLGCGQLDTPAVERGHSWGALARGTRGGAGRGGAGRGGAGGGRGGQAVGRAATRKVYVLARPSLTEEKYATKKENLSKITCVNFDKGSFCLFLAIIDTGLFIISLEFFLVEQPWEHEPPVVAVETQECQPHVAVETQECWGGNCVQIPQADECRRLKSVSSVLYARLKSEPKSNVSHRVEKSAVNFELDIESVDLLNGDIIIFFPAISKITYFNMQFCNTMKSYNGSFIKRFSCFIINITKTRYFFKLVYIFLSLGMTVVFFTRIFYEKTSFYGVRSSVNRNIFIFIYYYNLAKNQINLIFILCLLNCNNNVQ
ncbi:Protein of unknown function, partial [Gryllus bimaculatus]